MADAIIPRLSDARAHKESRNQSSMSIFITGSTGYLGAHVAANLLGEDSTRLNLLVRAKDEHESIARLWKALQLHLDEGQFREFIQSRITIFRGDITLPRFGLAESDYFNLVSRTSSIIHCAASLNRRSEKTCLNVNLRGSLEVVKLAQAIERTNGLRRFSHVSTVAVAGVRQNEVVVEDSAIDWNRSDYDPYARTKKFSEHMLNELLPDVSHLVFRPSIVLGDSRYPETTQFDMVRSFVFLASLPTLPFRPEDRIDIVNVDFVAGAISTLHQKERPDHDIYHLSSGTQSQTFRELTDAITSAAGRKKPLFVPSLGKSFSRAVNTLAASRGTAVGHGASLLKVFLPYLTFNTVFDNTRVVSELERKPVPFSKYCYPLLKFSREGKFTYPYRELSEAKELLVR